MTENFTAVCYLISAIFFILALKGLSHPESARNGNTMGIIAMVIAIVTTLFNPNVSSYKLIILGKCQFEKKISHTISIHPSIS